MNSHLKLLTLPWKYGQTKPGVELGAFRMSKYLLKYRSNIENKTLYPDTDNNLIYHKNVFYEKKKLGIDDNCIVLGGDHSIAIGSVLGTLNSGSSKKKGVIWIDAHADINTIEKSKSKNIHGMPLAFITGLENSWKWTDKLIKLKMKDLYYWGIRDIDPFEKSIINKTNTVDKIDEFDQIIEKYDYLHVSFDIDALDPTLTPSTGTPVNNGLGIEEVGLFFDKLITSKKNYTVDIVEYNPEIGNDTDKSKTWKSVNTILSQF